MTNTGRREDDLLDKIWDLTYKRDRGLSDLAQVAVANPELEALMVFVMDRLR